jgi:uroporphyrinogen III methyltransferase / synthase
VTVYLVGAGPGDPGLVTRRGLDLVRRADVLVYDRLASPEIVAQAPPGCLRIYAGKSAAAHAMSQDAINATLVEHGLAGRLVVRLKGGDPFVFGRGSEEAQALRDAAIVFEVVPGVTAGVAVPAYAGIPVTHRAVATNVTFVTGHEDPSKGRDDTNWEALAATGGTLVLYMGVGRLGVICDALIRGGRAASTPACVIANGTLATQAVREATLATIADAARGLAAPAITIIGDVCRLRDEIAWAETRPLAGQRIAVTRARDQQSLLAARLRDLGAAVIDAATIRSVAVAGAVLDPARYDLICLTSPNAPSLLLDRVGGDARRLAGVQVAAIGPGTAAALRQIGICADVVAQRAVAEGLVAALAGRVSGKRCLIARAETARDALEVGLRRAGAAVVDVAVLYRTVAERPVGFALADAELVTFTSASTVTNFTAAFADHDLSSVRGVSIGPVTTATARDAGVPIIAEAATHDLDGLVDAILGVVGNRH